MGKADEFRRRWNEGPHLRNAHPEVMAWCIELLAALEAAERKADTWFRSTMEDSKKLAELRRLAEAVAEDPWENGPKLAALRAWLEENQA